MHRTIHAAAEQEAVLLDMSDDEEYLADLQRENAELIVALMWVEPQDTKAGERVSNLGKWSGDEACLPLVQVSQMRDRTAGFTSACVVTNLPTLS